MGALAQQIEHGAVRRGVDHEIVTEDAPDDDDVVEHHDPVAGLGEPLEQIAVFGEPHRLVEATDGTELFDAQQGARLITRFALFLASPHVGTRVDTVGDLEALVPDHDRTAVGLGRPGRHLLRQPARRHQVVGVEERDQATVDLFDPGVTGGARPTVRPPNDPDATVGRLRQLVERLRGVVGGAVVDEHDVGGKVLREHRCNGFASARRGCRPG